MLTYVVQQVQNFPGLVLENSEKNEALRTFLEPTKFSLQREYCKPVYCCFQLYDGELEHEDGTATESGPLFSPRIVCTDSFSHETDLPAGVVVGRETITMSHRTVFLASAFSNVDDVEEALRYKKLEVKVRK